jgi:hypothetical protein
VVRYSFDVRLFHPLLHTACDARASGDPTRPALRAVLAEFEAIHERSLATPSEPFLSGRDVIGGAMGLTPGPAVGRILEELRDLQDAGTLTTRQQAIAHCQARRRAID